MNSARRTIADRKRRAPCLGGGDRLDEADLGTGIGLAVLDELVDELADRPFGRRRRSGSAGFSISRVVVVFASSG